MAKYRPPYREGEKVAVFYVDDDTVRLRSGQVDWVRRTGDETFEIGVAGRAHEVDALGEGSYVTKLDSHIKRELQAKGQGFEVIREDRLLELPEQRRERGYDLER